MNIINKKRQLFLCKSFATGLFILMAVLFFALTILQKNNPSHWIGYIRAFSEAAMVGALADWFAVTALFHYPLGLKIPHTNIIENSKEKIGDNLGNFVVENFLSPENIRPYIQKLNLSKFAGEWLSNERNQNNLVKEISNILLNIINKLEDETVVNFIGNKAKDFAKDIKIQKLVGNGLQYLIEKNDHQKLITSLSSQIKNYVLQNQNMVKERVKKESFSLIPKFVDDALANKITAGLSDYFREVEENEDHPLRDEISNKILEFSKDIQENEKWEADFQHLKDGLLNPEKINNYAFDIWNNIKKNLVEELSHDNSTLKRYVAKNVQEFALNLQSDEVLQQKIDGWIRLTAYKYILKNTHQFGDLISSTVGNWQGKELSEKLELEVGKDLQFIRVNGTLVGGLVGLIIYTISTFLT
ncbi:DUF445 domain-containing protein [Halpernia frigidisoli]|uniref:Uncharacterized membrane-anchored protein YjiN, DUF445 family n=1 Tax=Halpernia frigidisoli TaxID=1125876 RepID=A0A1I3GWL6_9FLAO|nr:DUF445 domain-containing protein [Halpernia frigidisoli]SFI27975.1 Uncharacterized membrane-anchored protein YjiN, DUF445 family [Halpernia frigidisoli]